MPSAKVLEQKKQIVSQLAADLTGACAGVLVDYKGINVADDTKLRRELRDANIAYHVVKNSLMKLAVQEAKLDGLGDALTGTTALAISNDDHVAAARILGKFATTHKNFTIKSGFLDADVIDLDMVISLSKLPSREILLATVCSAFNAPIAAFARAIQAVVEKNSAPETEEAAPETDAPVAEAAPEAAE